MDAIQDCAELLSTGSKDSTEGSALSDGKYKSSLTISQLLNEYAIESRCACIYGSSVRAG